MGRSPRLGGPLVSCPPADRSIAAAFVNGCETRLALTATCWNLALCSSRASAPGRMHGNEWYHEGASRARDELRERRRRRTTTLFRAACPGSSFAACGEWSWI